MLRFFWSLVGIVVWTAPLVAAEPAKLTPNTAQEPLAATYSPAKSAAFLDNMGLSWTQQRKCGTCHTNYPYLMSRGVIKGESNQALDEVRKFFEGRVAKWDGPEKADKPKWDAEVVATAVTLAINDAQTTGKLHPSTRQALDRMWTLQQANGGWTWLKCDWPPYEHDDYYGAVYAAVGVSMAPDGYAKTDAAQKGLAKLREYFKANPAPDLHHRGFLLWASAKIDGLMTSAEREQTVKELLALQRADGGWTLPSLGNWKRRDGSLNDKDAPSDGYGTGFVVFVLRQAGLPATDPQLQRGIKWLKANQRESGRWFTRSLNNDKAHYITNAGSCFAVLALAACNAP
jgi:squalene-hopene/tetraprenyl-beta-curcumene cyclase